MDTKITFQKVLVSLSFHCPPRIVCQRIWFYCGGVSCYFRGFVRFQLHFLPWLALHVLFVVPQTSRGCSFSKVEAIIYVENIVQSKTDKDSQIVFLTDALSATAAKYKLPNWKKTFLWVTFAVRKLCQQNKGQKHRKKTVASAHVYHNHIYLQTPTTTRQLPAAVKTGTRDFIYTSNWAEQTTTTWTENSVLHHPTCSPPEKRNTLQNTEKHQGNVEKWY